jgi:hypothetical protein
MAQNSLIHDLGKKGRLGNKVLHQVRNILLPFRRKRLLIPRTTPKRDDDNLPFLGGDPCQGSRARPEQCTSGSGSGGGPQKLATAPPNSPAEFLSAVGPGGVDSLPASRNLG